MRVGSGNDVFHKPDIFVAAGELTASAQHQRLVEAIFEMPVQRFHIAVLVGAPGVGALAFAAVVVQQCCIAIGENSAIGVISHGRTERIGAMPLRDTAKFPERFLNAMTECFKRFRKTQGDRFDVAVGQDAVKQCMVESLSGDHRETGTLLAPQSAMYYAQLGLADRFQHLVFEGGHEFDDRSAYPKKTFLAPRYQYG